MPTYKQLCEYVERTGVETLILNPTDESKETFEGTLFIRGYANISLILALA